MLVDPDAPTSSTASGSPSPTGKALPCGFDCVRRVILSVAKRNRTQSAPSNAKVESRRTPLRMTQECRSRFLPHPPQAVVSLRLGHRTALTLSTSFRTVPPLRYLPQQGRLYSYCCGSWFAVRFKITSNRTVCTDLSLYLRTWQYTASGMHLSGLTVHRTVIKHLGAATLLAAARSRSRENNTQLFSNTLAPLRYLPQQGRLYEKINSICGKQMLFLR